MECKACGKTIRKDDVFCKHCGVKVKECSAEVTACEEFEDEVQLEGEGCESMACQELEDHNKMLDMKKLWIGAGILVGVILVVAVLVKCSKKK